MCWSSHQTSDPQEMVVQINFEYVSLNSIDDSFPHRGFKKKEGCAVSELSWCELIGKTSLSFLFLLGLEFLEPHRFTIKKGVFLDGKNNHKKSVTTNSSQEPSYWIDSTETRSCWTSSMSWRYANLNHERTISHPTFRHLGSFTWHTHTACRLRRVPGTWSIHHSQLGQRRIRVIRAGKPGMRSNGREGMATAGQAQFLVVVPWLVGQSSTSPFFCLRIQFQQRSQHFLECRPCRVAHELHPSVRPWASAQSSNSKQFAREGPRDSDYIGWMTELCKHWCKARYPVWSSKLWQIKQRLSCLKLFTEDFPHCTVLLPLLIDLKYDDVCLRSWRGTRVSLSTSRPAETHGHRSKKIAGRSLALFFVLFVCGCCFAGPFFCFLVLFLAQSNRDACMFWKLKMLVTINVVLYPFERSRFWEGFPDPELDP